MVCLDSERRFILEHNLPIHACHLIGLVNLKLETKLNNPLHMAKLLYIGPRRQGK